MNKKTIYIILIIIFMIIIAFLAEIMKFGIKNGGFIINFDYELIKEEEYDISNTSDIEINLTSADVQVYITNDEKLKITQSGNKGTLEYKDSITDNEITISEEIKMFFGFMNHSKYKVYLPSNFSSNLVIKTVSGNFKLKDDIKLNNFEVKTTSGDIDLLGSITASTTEIKSVSGRLKLGNINSETVYLKATSGDISLNTLEAVETSIKTVSGNIKVETSANIISAETVSGNIKITSLNLKGDSKVNTVSGNVEIGISNDCNCKISTSSVSGDKNISQSKYGNGENNLKINTTSGNIEVD